MILFAQATVPMTAFKIDVLIGGTKKEVIEFHIKRYGITKEEAEPSSQNECATMTSDIKSELKGDNIFYVALEKKPILDVPVFIHELWHIMFQISDAISDLELNKNTQKWAACMIEDISQQILKAKYEKIYPLKK
jgi:hypothetical protein